MPAVVLGLGLKDSIEALFDNIFAVGFALIVTGITLMSSHYFKQTGKEYSFIKSKLADLLVSEISPVGKEINKLMNDKAYLLQILKKGTEKASIKAEENLKNIREKVGLI